MPTAKWLTAFAVERFGGSMPPRSLIIAYGNPLRNDDGVAWHAAPQFQKEFAANEVEVVCVHQLAPELAERAAQVEDVIFVDASGSGEPGQVRCCEVTGELLASNFTHWLTPPQLIALAHSLYNAHPRAVIVSVAGENFDHGDTLSTAVRSALPQLVQSVTALVTSYPGPPIT
jgi:hydrogenase maturation protease